MCCVTYDAESSGTVALSHPAFLAQLYIEWCPVCFWIISYYLITISLWRFNDVTSSASSWWILLVTAKSLSSELLFMVWESEAMKPLCFTKVSLENSFLCNWEEKIILHVDFSKIVFSSRIPEANDLAVTD